MKKKMVNIFLASILLGPSVLLAQSSGPKSLNIKGVAIVKGNIIKVKLDGGSKLRGRAARVDEDKFALQVTRKGKIEKKIIDITVVKSVKHFNPAE